MKDNPYAKILRGVYGCLDQQNNIVYVGSTQCTLERLEYNHRNAWNKGYTISKFRDALCNEGKRWKFVWLVERYKATQKEIETDETTMIATHDPRLNVDKNPVRSSIRYGRYS